MWYMNSHNLCCAVQVSKILQLAGNLLASLAGCDHTRCGYLAWHCALQLHGTCARMLPCTQERKQLYAAVRMEHNKGDLQYNRDHPGAGAAGRGDNAVSLHAYMHACLYVNIYVLLCACRNADPNCQYLTTITWHACMPESMVADPHACLSTCNVPLSWSPATTGM